jgi:hypothetical protein
MKRMQFGVLAIGAALILSEAPASAVVQLASVESQIIDYPLSTGPVNLAYNEFNPSLGQLIGITVSLDSYDAAESEVFSFPGAGVAYSGASVSDGTEIVSALGLSTSTASLAAGPFAGTTTGFPTIAGSGPTQHLTASEIVLSSDFSSFVGAGSEPFTVSVAPGTGTFSGHGQSSAVGFGGVINSYGAVEIDYSYIAVPEASGFSIVAGGAAAFMALGALVRQARRSSV